MAPGWNDGRSSLLLLLGSNDERSGMRKRRVIIIGALAVGALAASLACGTADARTTAGPRGDIPAEMQGPLRDVRRATMAYKDVKVAEAAGYVPAGPCEEDPKYGGMGIHYQNLALVEDGELDPLRPEFLVYQPTKNGELRLGAVEYFQVDDDQDLATDDDRPWMFDVPFDGPMLGHSPTMPIHYDLHVWLYRKNPAGIFAMWNPRVSCTAPPAASAAEEVTQR
jgi:hypothetical protein